VHQRQRPGDRQRTPSICRTPADGGAVMPWSVSCQLILSCTDTVLRGQFTSCQPTTARASQSRRRQLRQAAPPLNNVNISSFNLKALRDDDLVPLASGMENPRAAPDANSRRPINGIKSSRRGYPRPRWWWWMGSSSRPSQRHGKSPIGDSDERPHRRGRGPGHCQRPAHWHSPLPFWSSFSGIASFSWHLVSP
jgi:hypothetical protein